MILFLINLSNIINLKCFLEYSFLKADMEVDWLKMITQILLDI